MRGAGLELVFLGRPEGFNAPEIEEWLKELIGVAEETTRGPAADPAENASGVPRLLHNVLTGLLFYQSELWPGEAGPCTVVTMEDGVTAGFGCVGELDLVVFVDGEPVMPTFARVRDDQGRSAKAFMLDRSRSADLFVEWRSESPSLLDASVEARWSGESAAVAGAESLGPANPVPDESDLPDRVGVEPVVSATSVTEFAEPRAPIEKWEPDGPVRESEPSLLPEPLAGESRSSGSDQARQVDYPESPARRERGDWHFKSWVDGLARSVEASVDAAAAAEAQAGGEGRVSTSEQDSAPLEPATRAIVRDPENFPDLVPPSPESDELAAKAAPIDWIEPPFEPALETVQRAVDSEVAAHVYSNASEIASDTDGTLSGAEALVNPAEHPESSLVAPARRMVRSGPPRRLDLPPVSEGDSRAERVRRFAPWVGIVLVLFIGGWVVGSMDLGRKQGGPGAIARTLDRLGFGPARFDLAVTSRPEGAAIIVDGTEVGRRTPAVVQLPPGAHQITLSFPGLGSASYNVRGQRGEKVPLASALWGSLIVSAPEGTPPVSVTVDEIGRGMAPITVDSLSPGIHQVRFSGPGIQPWERAVEVRVNEAAELIAQGTLTPATGFVEVRATLTDEAASRPLTGATVWVDGAARGSTPLRLELPQGQHSLRVEYRGEGAPVQVLDLPGGNQRFVSFELGGAGQRPRLVQTSPFAPIPLHHPTVMSAALEGVGRREVRDMWLHVRTPDGTWRRYPMNTLEAAGGVVGVSVFPSSLFDAKGRAPYYLSASTQTGDEYFTEIRLAQAAGDPSEH